MSDEQQTHFYGDGHGHAAAGEPQLDDPGNEPGNENFVRGPGGWERRKDPLLDRALKANPFTAPPMPHVPDALLVDAGRISLKGAAYGMAVSTTFSVPAHLDEPGGLLTVGWYPDTDEEAEL